MKKQGNAGGAEGALKEEQEAGGDAKTGGEGSNEAGRGFELKGIDRDKEPQEREQEDDDTEDSNTLEKRSQRKQQGPGETNKEQQSQLLQKRNEQQKDQAPRIVAGTGEGGKVPVDCCD